MSTLLASGSLGAEPMHSSDLADASSLYRGITPPLLGVTPIFAISFWVSDPICRCRIAGNRRSEQAQATAVGESGR